MTKITIKGILYLITLVLTISFVSASNMTIEELIESYDYDYYDGTLNITTFDDFMLDTNNNTVNDTLTINLTIDTTEYSSYLFIVSLHEDGNLIQNYTNKTLSAGDLNVQVNFSTRLLKLNQYNYTVDVRDQSYGLVYSKYKVETAYYSDYEEGMSLINISDQNINNDSLRVTFNLNVSYNATKNITVFLGYDDSIISSYKLVNLTTPLHEIDVDFDNETIKLTRHNGVFSLEGVKVGTKILNMDYNTSSYDYEDFAKTSYIKNITSAPFDNNSNNLSDALQFNFTIIVKSNDNYTIDATVYDSSDNYITSLSKNESLSNGTQIVTIEIPGEDIYSTYYNGEFILSYAKLSVGNDTKDIIYNAHTTNITYYSDFERPKLPDLTISMNTTFSSVDNTTNITINVTNIGNAPAFNVIIDIYDNNTYENQTPISFINISESIILNYTAPNTSEDSIITAIVDFNNLVDESNESNNIAQIYPTYPINISVFEEIYRNGKIVIFELQIQNVGEENLQSINWSINTGLETIYSDNLINLSVNEKAIIYVEYNYNQSGEFTVTASATDITNSDEKTIDIYINDIDVYNLSRLHDDGSMNLFEFYIQNKKGDNLNDINWSLDTGNETIYSTYPINLTNDETIFVYTQYNYSQEGDYTVIASAIHNESKYNDSIDIEVRDIGISNLIHLYDDNLYNIFSFTITNRQLTEKTDLNWTFDTDDNEIIPANQYYNLTAGEEIFVFLENNFSSSGTYNVNATAINGNTKDSLNHTFTIS